MNLTQAAWTSWVCNHQAANCMRTELFFQGGGGVAEISSTSCFKVAGIEIFELNFRISIPGPCWSLDTQICTGKKLVCSSGHTHTPVQELGGAGCVITKIPFKPGTQDFPFQINQDQIPKHFISASGFPNQTKQWSDLRERVSSFLFYPDLSTHHAWEPWWTGTERRKVTPADPHINVTC